MRFFSYLLFLLPLFLINQSERAKSPNKNRAISENITIAEFDRVAREHRDLFKQLGRKVAWYEQICD